MEDNKTPMLPKKVERQLTTKNKSFLQHLANGRPTLEAYKLAGYNGEPHAAYELRYQLKAHLATLLEQGGFSRETVAIEVNKLMALPLSEEIKNVNFKQKLDLLRFMDKALPKEISGARPSITPFKLNMNFKGPVTVESKSPCSNREHCGEFCEGKCQNVT